MRRGEHARDLASKVRELADREPALARDAATERFALETLHHQIRLALVKTDVEDLRDPGVLDAADDARLVEQPVDVVGVLRDLREEHLDGYTRLNPDVLGDIHLAHPTSTEK